MARYIDADNVKLKGICIFDQNLEILVPLSDVRKALQMTPTADAVEVVRCKDCKFFDSYDKVEDFDGQCVVRNCETDKEEFCSYGRKQADEK